MSQTNFSYVNDHSAVQIQNDDICFAKDINSIFLPSSDL